MSAKSLKFLAPAVGAAEAPEKSNKIKGRPSAKQPSDLHCAHRSDTVKCANLGVFAEQNRARICPLVSRASKTPPSA